MSDTTSTDRPDLGPNEGMVDEMFRLFQDDPEAVPESWREFFADYKLGGTPIVASSVPPPPEPAPLPEEEPAPPPPPPPPPPSGASDDAHAPVLLAGETSEPLRGAAARIVKNMEASLEVPTATSVRAVPAKLLEVNRQILNNHLKRGLGGKVSFTHLIGYAVLRALRS